MNMLKFVTGIVILAMIIVPISTGQEELLSYFGKSSDSESKINFQDMLNSAKYEEQQIPQQTKDIAYQEVMKKFESTKNVPVIVWLNDGQSPKSIYKNLRGFKVKYVYDQLGGFAGTATKEAVDSLKNNDKVDYIALDQLAKANLMESRPIIQADAVQSNYGITGKGVGVCHLDTGVNYNHPALIRAYAGGYDFINNDNDPMDDNGHGTATAGAIASNDSTDKGISPGVNLLAVKVLDSNSFGYWSTITAGINWCVANKNLYNISVISMSLGSVGFTYTPTTSPGYIEPALQTAYNLNIVPVASSGNEGALTGISYPAVSPYVISTAASYDADLGSYGHGNCTDLITNPNIMTCYSNRASFLDIVAPGTVITTTTVQGSFGGASGTSMAAPHISGTIALMKQRNPQMKVSQIEKILKSTGAPIYDSATSLTFKRVNALNAVKAVPYMTVTGTFAQGKTMYMNISDPMNPGAIYVSGLSFGNSPGIPLPNGLILPLNYDPLLQATISPNGMFAQSVGVLDSNGKGMATFNVPNYPGIESFSIYTGFLVLDTNSPEFFVSVSNAWKL